MSQAINATKRYRSRHRSTPTTGSRRCALRTWSPARSPTFQLSWAICRLPRPARQAGCARRDVPAFWRPPRLRSRGRWLLCAVRSTVCTSITTASVCDFVADLRNLRHIKSVPWTVHEAAASIFIWHGADHCERPARPLRFAEPGFFDGWSPPVTNAGRRLAPTNLFFPTENIVDIQHFYAVHHREPQPHRAAAGRGRGRLLQCRDAHDLDRGCPRARTR